MPRREIEAGPLIAAGGGLLLLVSLFLDWFEQSDRFEGFSAWTGFEVWDLVLAGLALAAMLPAAELAGVPRWLSDRAFAGIGAAAVAIVASQLINHPPAGIDRGLEVGAWLGFAGSLAMLVGSASSLARISLAVSVSDRPEEGGPEGAPPRGGPPPAGAPGEPSGTAPEAGVPPRPFPPGEPPPPGRRPGAPAPPPDEPAASAEPAGGPAPSGEPGPVPGEPPAGPAPPGEPGPVPGEPPTEEERTRRLDEERPG